MPSLVLPSWLLTAVRVTLVVAVLWSAWQPGIAAPYQYDDTVTPLKDPASQSLTSWVEALPRTLRPLTKLSYALESSAGARDAPERRALNALLFVAATLVLAQLCQEAGLSSALSLLLALLWAVHPVHAETVLALAGRSVLLSLLLCLLSALSVLRGRARLALPCALLAVLARETALPWLVVCAALSARPQLTARGLAAVMVSAATLGALLVFASPRMRQLIAFSYGDPSLADKLRLQWAAVPRELFMWVAQPNAFTVDIDFAPRGLERLAHLLAALLLYVAFAWLAWHAKARVVRVAALLWLCLVLPLHSVVPKLDPLTARSMSASSAALVVLLAFAWKEASQRGPRSKYLVASALLAPLLYLSFLTHQRATLYRDPIALWRDAAERSRESTRPLVNLGTLLAQKGQLEEARASLQEAVRRDPHSSDARERLRGVETLLETRRLLMDSPPSGNQPSP